MRLLPYCRYPERLHGVERAKPVRLGVEKTTWCSGIPFKEERLATLRQEVHGRVHAAAAEGFGARHAVSGSTHAFQRLLDGRGEGRWEVDCHLPNLVPADRWPSTWSRRAAQERARIA